MCEELIQQYRQGQNGKPDTILALWETLLDAPTIRGGGNLAEALRIYLKVLDKIDQSNRSAQMRGPESSSQTLSEGAVGGLAEQQGTSNQEEETGGSDKYPSSSESGDDRTSWSKHHKLNESKLLWLGKREANVACTHLNEHGEGSTVLRSGFDCGG